MVDRDGQSKVYLSIIVVSHNTRELLKKCLASIFDNLKSATFTYEVIVVDNASTDGSRQMVKQLFPTVSLIENKENVGFGRANNQSAKLSKGEYLLFLNSDIEVLNSAIAKLYQFSKQHKKPGIYGGKLFNKDKTAQASCGYFYTFPIVVLSLFFKGDQLQITRFSPGKATYTDWVSGACLLLAREIFISLGGFDEAIFMYMDEVDLCYRAKRKGIPVIFYPGAHFIHLGSASSKDRRAPYVNLFGGLLYFYQKHWPEKLGILKVLLATKALLAITIGYFVRSQSLIKHYKMAWRIVRGFH